MAEITPDQVARLLRAVETANEAQTVADAAQKSLDQVLLSTAREARVGLRELSALTGLHSNTVRARIQRAAGPATVIFEQPELDFEPGTFEDSSAVRAAFPESANDPVGNKSPENGPAIYTTARIETVRARIDAIPRSNSKADSPQRPTSGPVGPVRDIRIDSPGI